MLYLYSRAATDENDPIAKAISVLLKLWAIAFRDISKHRRMNILARTDPDFINLLKDPRNFSPKELNKLFGRKFVKEMSADAADETRMEDNRQRRSRFQPRDGNTNSAWRNNQGSFNSDPTPFRRENVNFGFPGNGFVMDKIHFDDNCKVGARLSLFWKNWEKIMQKERVDQIIKTESPYCEASTGRIINHLSSMFAGSDHLWEEPPSEVPDFSLPSSEFEKELMLRPINPEEAANRLARMSNTAPGPDGVRYSCLKKVDPGAHVLARLFTLSLMRI